MLSSVDDENACKVGCTEISDIKCASKRKCEMRDTGNWLSLKLVPGASRNL